MAWCRQETSENLIQEFLRSGSTVRNKMMKNWGVIGGIAAAMAAGVYVLWGPITDGKRRKRGMVPGLLNLGNTCFLNSLLQGLASCPSFIKWLEKRTQRRGGSEGEPEKEHQLSSTLLDLLTALSSDGPGEEDLLDAGCLLDVLRLYRWHITSFEEQDAHELFHVLTSSLEEERDQRPKVAPLFDMQSLESLPDVEQTLHCRSRGPLHPIPSPWKSQLPFHGRLTSNMACKRCEQQSPVRYDSFDSLSLSIPSPQWGRPVSLDHCLQHFISSETIKEVECENCTKLQHSASGNRQVLVSQRTTFIKQLKLGKLPQCLCIHLQRLTWSNEGTPIKRQEHVQFTEYLSMDRYKHRSSMQRQQHSQGSPKTSQGSSRNSQGSPRTSQGSTRNSQGSTITSQGSSMTSQGSPRTSQGSSMTSQGSPRTSQGSSMTSQGSPRTSQGSSRNSQGSSMTSQGSPRTSQADESGEAVEKDLTAGAEHLNNNKPLSNGTSFLRSPGLNPQLNFTYDYSSPSEYLFQLMAVLVHHGDMHSGHFVTYRRSPPTARCPSPVSSQWLWVSDDSVRKASLQEALSSNAYLLFYERVRRLGPARRSEE